MKIRTDFLNTPPASQLAGNAAANTTNFASLLQQQSRAPALAPKAAAEPPQAAPGASQASSDYRKTESSSNASTDAADETVPDDAANKPRPTNKPRARQAGHIDAQAPARAPREDAAAARTEKKSAAATDEESSTTPADPKAQGDAATPNWFAVLMAPPTTAAPTGAAGAQRGTSLAEAADGTDTLPGDADAASTAIGATRGRGLPNGARKIDAREALDPADADRGTLPSSKEPTSSLPGFAAVLAEQRHAEATPHHDAAMPSVDAARSALASNAPANTSASQDAGHMSNAQVHAAVGSPEFPQELGVQLSVLARDGVQQAELHLNPTEMGPVSVQIVMDGTQARIDFGADVAATRHAIEAGLPELASALRDAGFTLAGGGVSQHASGRQGSEGDGARRDGGAVRGIASRTDGSDGSDGSDTTSRVVRTRISAGGVDVYA